MKITHVASVAFALFCASSIGAQSFTHGIAFINDARSHGKLGDKLLSLNEVILLNRQIITRKQLSKEEQAQLFGSNDLAWADVDEKRTAKITFERDLDTVGHNPHGFVIGGVDGRVVFDMGTTRGLVIDSDFCDLRNLELRGGKTGVTLLQRDAIYGTQVRNVLFTGQSVAGFDATLRDDNGFTELLFEDCRFVGLPTAVRLRDVGRKRQGRVAFVDTSIEGGREGLVFDLGAGGLYDLTLRHLRIDGTSTGVALRRASGMDRGLKMLCDAVRMSAVDIGLSIDGHPSAAVDLVVQLCEVAGRSKAIAMTSAGSSLTLRDSRLSGGVQLRGGQRPVHIDNCHLRGGEVLMSTAGAALELSNSIIEGVILRSSGSRGLAVDECVVRGSSVLPATTATLTRCYITGTTLGSGVRITNSRPLPQLGTMEVTPLEPSIGSNLTLSTELPAGLFGVWLFGSSLTDPLSAAGVRVYMEPRSLTVIPGLLSGSSKRFLPIPRAPSLVGLDVTFQLLVAPGVGMSAPALAAPPAQRVLLR